MLLRRYGRVIIAFVVIMVVFSSTGIGQTGKKQSGNIKGRIADKTGNPVVNAKITLIGTGEATNSDQLGFYFIKRLKPSSYYLCVTSIGFDSVISAVIVKPGETTLLNVELPSNTALLQAVTVNGVRTITGMGRLDEMHDGVIYSGKKTEVLLLDSLNANTAQNNPRQVLGRIPGANYSETQGSGFPSNGIGFRGLKPTQSVEMNTRQNGYNITADIYGYAETYYQPPLEAVQRIEVTRGESSLQFGPQFGGVINYIIRDGNKTKPFEYCMQQTGGSNGLVNSFHSVGGQIGKWNYYVFAQYQSSQGWRPNSDYRQISAFGKLSYQANAKLKLSLEYTLFRNRIHMPGGFTDEQFAKNSDTSFRARNWLENPWNIVAAKMEYAFSPKTSLTVTSSYLFSARNLVWKNEDGGPGTPDSISPVTLQYVNREVQREKMNSLTTEARLLSQYSLFGMNNTLGAGARIFYGKFKRQGGGQGTTGSDFTLSLLDPRYEYGLDFTTTNVAPFIENVFRVTDNLSITPGIRYEYLRSTAKGYITIDGDQVNTDSVRKRYVPLMGVGVQYRTTRTSNLYANISQAYSPITYDQVTPYAVASKIDPNLKDAKGYNADFGWRGSFSNYLNFDVNAFYLSYGNRIGLVQLKDGAGNPYTYRTNVANSVHKGIETYVEFSPTKLAKTPASLGTISFFNSFSYIHAKYTSGPYKGNFVEYAPEFIERFGITYSRKHFSSTFILSQTARSFGDANNTVSSSDAIVGVIPAYTVMDWAVTIPLAGNWNIKTGINNLADKRYFTLRTDEYPGPGIIPAIGRSFYISFGARF
ncbi:TonB-dependent receptor domain-containing protein [Flavitalea flava]